MESVNKVREEIANCKRLRDVSGCNALRCREALREAGGDYDKALQLLHAKIYESMRRSGGVMED